MLRADITHFFDNISWDILKVRLGRVGGEEEVLELIRMNACTAMLDDVSGELKEKTVEMHQGSAIATILSNIFMMDFDSTLLSPEHFKESLPEPSLRQHSDSYICWQPPMRLGTHWILIPAYENMLQLQREIERDRKLHRDYLLMDFSLHIDRQCAMLEYFSRIPPLQRSRSMQAILEDADILYVLALTIYQNAKTREEQEKYDLSPLLLYRLLVMMSQRRLSCYGIFPSSPDYRRAKYNMHRLPELREMNGESRLQWMADRFRNI